MRTEHRFVDIAEACKPALLKAWREPVDEVEVVADPAAFQGWRPRRIGSAAAVATRDLGRGDALTLDFGEHLVGRLRLSVQVAGRAADAPARLRLIFAEMPAEVAEPFEPFAGAGKMSRAWLQDEVINLDDLPGAIELPRRYAFRWLRIEVVDTSPAFRIRLAEVRCAQEGAEVAPIVPDPGLPEDLALLDAVARRTLRNCMQTVFEDGPKRDRRLWIGDLRLQALTNAVTFRRFDLVKRCLYLLAAFSREEDGAIGACCYERPVPTADQVFLLDYTLLMAATLADYLGDTGDLATARDLWPVVRRQLGIGLGLLHGDLFTPESGAGRWWLFVDWQPRLDRHVAEHGMLVYSLRRGAELAAALGETAEAKLLSARAEVLALAARRAWLDPASGILRTVAGQSSWANQAWAVLSGITDAAEGARGLRAVAADADAVRPAGPYLWHHVVHAQLLCGLDREALDLLRSYWGGMIRAGADTFFEVYDPADEKLTPYGTHLINSACHAWSCTPAWFLRRWRERLLAVV